MKLESWAYVKGINEAVAYYKDIFGFEENEEHSWKHEDGTYEICSFKLENGTHFCIAEREGEFALLGQANTGNIMQMCLMYDKEEACKLETTYEKLKSDSQILMPLQAVDFTSHTCDLIDKFGVRWCLMVW